MSCHIWRVTAEGGGGEADNRETRLHLLQWVGLTVGSTWVGGEDVMSAVPSQEVAGTRPTLGRARRRRVPVRDPFRCIVPAAE